MPAGQKIISLPQRLVRPSLVKVRVLRKARVPKKELDAQLRSATLRAVRAALGSLDREGVLTPSNIARVIRRMPELTSEFRTLIMDQAEKRSRKTFARGILRVVPGDHITLPATTGQEILGSSDLFSDIDPHYHSYGCGVLSTATKEVEIKVCDLVKDATISEIFPSDTDLDRLCLTQGQIGAYVVHHGHMLLERGYTSFLFKVGDGFLVANIIGVPSKGLRLVITQLSYKTSLLASHNHRVVIPCRRSILNKTFVVS